jgi:hypothetical protein
MSLSGLGAFTPPNSSSNVTSGEQFSPMQGSNGGVPPSLSSGRESLGSLQKNNSAIPGQFPAPPRPRHIQVQIQAAQQHALLNGLVPAHAAHAAPHFLPPMPAAQHVVPAPFLFAHHFLQAQLNAHEYAQQREASEKLERDFINSFKAT